MNDHVSQIILPSGEVINPSDHEIEVWTTETLVNQSSVLDNRHITVIVDGMLRAYMVLWQIVYYGNTQVPVLKLRDCTDLTCSCRIVGRLTFETLADFGISIPEGFKETYHEPNRRDG